MFRVTQKVRSVRGEEHSYTVIEHPGAVTIVPYRDGRFGLIRQFRPAIDREILEFPAGTLEPPEPPRAAAERELGEEMGLAASEWQELGRFYLAPGYSSEFMYVFLARGLTGTPNGRELQGGEEIGEEVWLSLAELQAAARRGEIMDAKTLAAIGYLTWLDAGL